MSKCILLVDANVFSSLLHKDDALHRNAKEIFEIISKNNKVKIIVPPIILYEICTVALKKGIDKKIIKEKTQRIIDWNKVSIVSLSELSIYKHINRTARNHVREPAIKTNDLIILNTALELDAALVSTDKKLLKSAKRLKVPCCRNSEDLLGLL